MPGGGICEIFVCSDQNVHYVSQSKTIQETWYTYETSNYFLSNNHTFIYNFTFTSYNKQPVQQETM